MIADMGDAEALAELRRRYPKVAIWRGDATGRWWAMAPGAYRFVEGRTAADLGSQLAGMLARPEDRRSPH